MEISYQTKVVNIRRVSFSGKLFANNNLYYYIDEGNGSHLIEDYLDRFLDKHVKLTIELLGYDSDDSDILDDEHEEWRCYDLH